MSSYAKPSFAATLRAFALADGLPFADVLADDLVQRLADEEGVHFAEKDHHVFSPPITLFAWLSQALSDAKSCVAAVARVLVFRVAIDLPPCSGLTGGFCKARAKLPEPLVRRLALHVGDELERQAPDGWRWHGRRVLLADGTECSMPDTPANQAAYRQSTTQKPGLGFPQIRLVVLLAFATAALVGCVLGPRQGKGNGETSLFRELFDRLQAGDVVVADRYYCGWFLIALLRQRGVDVCFRLHAKRHADFRKGRRLGREDHVVGWARPPRPEWMDEETYRGLPESLELRQVRVRVAGRGYRVRELVVVTTLLETQAYRKEDIADLYHRRWHAELDIRNIKQTMGMDVLSCRSPEMVRKEVWVHLLAYNLVRQVMAQAALLSGKAPRGLSFAAARQTLDAFRWVRLLDEGGRRGELGRLLCLAVQSHEVGKRPGRREPRARKRRPKPGGLLTRPRPQERARLLRGHRERRS